MRKEEFLTLLRIGLHGLPQDDIDERVLFYSEMIDDRMEEGLSETEAVSAAGSVDGIVAQSVAEIPLAKIAKERMKPKRQIKVWEIVLLALGAPIWLSLGIAAFAAILSLYISLWSVIISLWAVFVSLICCSLAGIAAGIGFVFVGNGLEGGAMIGIGIFCAGLSIFTFFGCKGTTMGAAVLTKRFVLWIKNCFMRREEAQ